MCSVDPELQEHMFPPHTHARAHTHSHPLTGIPRTPAGPLSGPLSVNSRGLAATGRLARVKGPVFRGARGERP